MIEFDSPDKFIGTTAALILGGLSAAGAIGGAKIAANASTSAAKTESDAAKQAADYSAGQTSKAMDYINGLRATAQPGSANSSAYATLARLTGGGGLPSGPGAPMAPGVPAPTFASPTAASASPYSTLFGTAGTSGAPSPTDAMVTLQDDTGMQRRVPRAAASRFIAQGARVVS